MAMEKDFIQSMKLEISRNFSLNPYERTAFHKILSIIKSDNGMNILLRDISRKGVLRSSAVENLKHFDNRRVTETFSSLLSDTKLHTHDTLSILEHIENYGTDKEAEQLCKAAGVEYKFVDSFSGYRATALGDR